LAEVLAAASDNEEDPLRGCTAIDVVLFRRCDGGGYSVLKRELFTFSSLESVNKGVSVSTNEPFQKGDFVGAVIRFLKTRRLFELNTVLAYLTFF
jgi:hypothetical protein